MRVSRAQAAENRQNVIDTASHLFRENGFDGIGLKDLMKNAGLTQGAFYKQFASKDDLAAEASRRALESATRRWSAAIDTNPKDPLGAVIEHNLSMAHRAERADGCPIVALGGDAARQGRDVKASFESGIRTHVGILESLIAKTGSKGSRGKALAILSTMIGAMTLARAVNDEVLAQDLLDAAADQVRATAAAGTPAAKRARRERK